MDYSGFFFIVSAGAIIFVVGLYIVLRWRKAPTAFRAMSYVAVASFAAGVLLGLSSMQMLGAWMRSGTGESASTPAIRTGAPAPSPALRVPAREGTLAAARSTHVGAAGPASGILASYVGPALRWSDLNVKGPNGWESWDNVDKGCQLGNYTPTSALCRAARLAAGGWSDASSIPFRDIAKFCAAGYLEKARALCWWSQHGRLVPHALSTVTERVPGEDVWAEFPKLTSLGDWLVNGRCLAVLTTTLCTGAMLNRLARGEHIRLPRHCVRRMQSTKVEVIPLRVSPTR